MKKTELNQTRISIDHINIQGYKDVRPLIIYKFSTATRENTMSGIFPDIEAYNIASLLISKSSAARGWGELAQLHRITRSLLNSQYEEQLRHSTVKISSQLKNN